MISFLFPSPNSADVFATSPQYTEDMDQKHPKGVSRTGFQDSFMVRESGFSLLKVKYLKIKKAHVYLLQTGALTQLLTPYGQAVRERLRISRKSSAQKVKKSMEKNSCCAA